LELKFEWGTLIFQLFAFGLFIVLVIGFGILVFAWLRYLKKKSK